MSGNELVAGLIEVRGGRLLFCRHRTVSSSVAVCSVTKDNLNLALVCLHGTAANHRQFLPFIDALEALVLSAIDGVTLDCWMYDAVGCGDSPLLDDDDAYSDSEQINDLRALLQKQVQKEYTKIFLLGHSYAPNLIYKFILQQKDFMTSQAQEVEISGVVIVCSGLHNEQLQMQKGGPTLFKAPLWLLNCLQPLLTKLFLRIGFSEKTHSEKPDIIKEAEHANNKNDMKVVRLYYHAHDWLQDIAPVQNCYQESGASLAPLILHGIEDQIIPISCGQELANRWNVPLVSIPDAGHMLLIEQPTVVARHVFDYITS